MLDRWVTVPTGLLAGSRLALHSPADFGGSEAAVAGGT
jgi:hypothetical protein